MKKQMIVVLLAFLLVSTAYASTSMSRFYIPVLFHSGPRGTSDPCREGYPYPPPPGLVCPTRTLTPTSTATPLVSPTPTRTRNPYPAPGETEPPPIPSATSTASPTQPQRRLVYVPDLYKEKPILTTPVPQSFQVVITWIHSTGTGPAEPGEYVEIQNQDARAIQLQGWVLRDAADHAFTFPQFTFYPGQFCRIYTNQSNPDYCGLTFASPQPIWDDPRDTALLFDAEDRLISSYTYP